MHILLRYYETNGATREEKVKGSLESMGASMMLGGFTTFLGVIPLAFSTTKIFTVSHDRLWLLTTRITGVQLFGSSVAINIAARPSSLPSFP